MESLNLPSILTPDFGLLFWMLVAFIFLFIILAKFGFPVITGMVEQRKAFIDESLSHAKAANEKLAGIQAESEKVLREATATRDAMVKEAQTLAEAEGLKLLDEAKAQIQVEKANALRDIRSQVADLSVQVAEKIIRQQLSNDTERTNYINGLLDDIEKQ